MWRGWSGSGTQPNEAQYVCLGYKWALGHAIRSYRLHEAHIAPWLDHGYSDHQPVPRSMVRAWAISALPRPAASRPRILPARPRRCSCSSACHCPLRRGSRAVPRPRTLFGRGLWPSPRSRSRRIRSALALALVYLADF